MVLKKDKSGLRAIYLAGFLFAVHLASVSYINSSLIKQFTSNGVLNILYITGSVFGIVFLTIAPILIKKYGSLKTLVVFSFIKTLSVFGLAFLGLKNLVLPLFVINISIDSVIYFFLDINLEKETKVEGTTGRKRGSFLTIQNTAWVISPLALVFLTGQNSFSKVYIFSALSLLAFVAIATSLFKNIKETTDKRVFPMLGFFKATADQKKIVGIQFILNFFYAWMVIYLPILLNQEIGFGWDKIGFLFPIMLLPFLLFELPTGFLADKKFGEKEILIIGFLVMAVSTFFIPTIETSTFWIWAIVLFITRIGASLVEASSESFFFKHVKEADAGLISNFRMVRPFAYILAPLVAIPVIHFFSYSSLFYGLALSSLLGLLFIPKKDTR